MFELSVACKYLIPRWRQLSVSIISVVSTLVIALVVWLIVVFFSVKNGLENNWIEKIVALTAPVRITPTEKYYQSYYYLVDTISGESNYTPKNIGEKLQAAVTDPYNHNFDEELPSQWPKPDRDVHGEVKDLVKVVAQSASQISGLKDLKITDFETTFANLRLRLLRPTTGQGRQSQQFIDQTAYLGSFDSDAHKITKILIPLSKEDFQNILMMQGVYNDNLKQNSSETLHPPPANLFQKRLQDFFELIRITRLKTPLTGWRIPLELLPRKAKFAAIAVFKGDEIVRAIIPANSKAIQNLLNQQAQDGIKVVAAEINIDDGTATLKAFDAENQTLSPWTSLILQGNSDFPVTLLKDSLELAVKPTDIRFKMQARIQGVPIEGEIPLGKLEIAEADLIQNDSSSIFAHPTKNSLALSIPENDTLGEAILLPRNFRDAGALVGDQGHISYYSPTPSSIQEQRIPVFVAGFYDPGIMPIGGKYILANKGLVGQVRSSYNQEDHALAGNGLNIRFSNLNEVMRVKTHLLKALNDEDVAGYWNVETYQEYEFAKDLMQQLQSEKNLFSLISVIIIIVACSNIISMLIILVNDKKLEIGILRSMGATSASVAAIFGICGMVMGAFGSIVGIIAAMITLRHINELVGLISYFQGYDLFNPIFYGTTLPSDLSYEALLYVILATALISLLAGIIPAVKASLIRPSAILRSE